MKLTKGISAILESLMAMLIFSLPIAFSAEPRRVATGPVRVASGQGAQAPKQPQACVGADGKVHIVYGVADQIYYCQSSNGGDTFKRPQPAFKVANLSLGMRRGPRIVCNAKALVITAVGGPKGKGQDGDVVAWRSEDDGASWQGPVRVNDALDSAREGLHAMASSPGGTIYCVWLDLRSKRTELYASCSTENGAKWSENVLVYQSPDGSICQCCHPSIAVDTKAIHVLFRNSLGGNRDMYIASSMDGKLVAKPTFSKAERLGLGHWSLNACPMDGGMLSVDSAGRVSTVWRRGGDLFCTSLGLEGEALIGHGEQPWIADSSQGPIAVWTEGRVGELKLKYIHQPETPTVVLDPTARDPMIVSREGLQPIIVCWESITDSQSSLMAMQIVAK